MLGPFEVQTNREFLAGTGTQAVSDQTDREADELQVGGRAGLPPGADGSACVG